MQGKNNFSIEVVHSAESLQIQAEVTLISGMEYLLDTFGFPIDTMDQPIIYTKDNSKVAIVSGNGVIRAKQARTAKITAKSENGMVYDKKVGTTELIIKENLSGKTDSVVVRVTQ